MVKRLGLRLLALLLVLSFMTATVACTGPQRRGEQQQEEPEKGKEEDKEKEKGKEEDKEKEKDKGKDEDKEKDKEKGDE